MNHAHSEVRFFLFRFCGCGFGFPTSVFEDGAYQRGCGNENAGYTKQHTGILSQPSPHSARSISPSFSAVKEAA